MKLYITDVSVLFDILELGILPEFFALNAEICTTIFVYNEVVKIAQVEEIEIYKRSQKLTILEVTESEVEEINQHPIKRNLKSFPDKSLLWKALQQKGVLLTCDGKLKKEALDFEVEVHGSIWVITELEKQKILNTEKIIELLEQLKIINSRLPMNEIDRIINKLKSTKK